MSEFKTIALQDIRPDQNQPRKFYDESAMTELTASIKEKGVLQPILIRPNGKGYILVCGERRFRASKEAGLQEIPAVIREMSEDEALELQIIENLQRKDVHPLEEAVAFKSLVENKTRVLTIEDVAAKVGKSVYYVRQRMKLNSLSAGWQRVFYAHRIETAEALAVGQLAANDQEQLFKQKVYSGWEKNRDIHISVSSWDIERTQRKLNGASFDRKDETLNPKMGACTSCQFNTAVASLFPEENKEPKCNNGECFKVKCDVAFERKLVAVKEDPAVILVDNEYGGSKGIKVVEALKKEGHKVYSRGYTNSEFQQVFSPKKAEIDSGKYLKAFVVNGSETGQFIYVKLTSKSSGKGSSKSTAEKIKGGKANSDDITAEIKRIQDREKRSKELDGEKLWSNIRSLIPAHTKSLFTTAKLSQSEMTAFAIAMEEKLGFSCAWVEEQFGKKNDFSNITELGINVMARIFIMDVLPTAYGSHLRPDTGNQFVYNVLKEYLPEQVAMLESEQKEAAAKRQARVTKRIADLQAQKKELTKPKAAAKKPVLTGNGRIHKPAPKKSAKSKAKSKK